MKPPHQTPFGGVSLSFFLCLHSHVTLKKKTTIMLTFPALVITRSQPKDDAPHTDYTERTRASIYVPHHVSVPGYRQLWSLVKSIYISKWLGQRVCACEDERRYNPLVHHTYTNLRVYTGEKSLRMTRSQWHKHVWYLGSNKHTHAIHPNKDTVSLFTGSSKHTCWSPPSDTVHQTREESQKA